MLIRINFSLKIDRSSKSMKVITIRYGFTSMEVQNYAYFSYCVQELISYDWLPPCVSGWLLLVQLVIHSPLMDELVHNFQIH